MLKRLLEHFAPKTRFNLIAYPKLTELQNSACFLWSTDVFFLYQMSGVDAAAIHLRQRRLKHYTWWTMP